MDERQTEIYNKIDDLLYYEWNPIGIDDLPREEYQSYTSDIFSLKIHSANKIKIAEQLFHIATATMGLTGNMKQCEDIAQKILEI